MVGVNVMLFGVLSILIKKHALIPVASLFGSYGFIRVN